MMKKLLTLLLCIIINLSSFYSQNNKIDSLENLLSKAKYDTTKASLLAQIGFEYKVSDPLKAKKYGEKALEISLKTKYKPTTAASYNVIGIYYYMNHEMPIARTYFFKSLKIYKNLNNIKGIASCLGNISSTYSEQAMFDSAIYAQKEALEYSLKLKDEKGIANSYQNLGNTYNLKGDYQIGTDYLFKALKIFEKIQQDYGIGMCLYNISRAFYMQEKYSEAVLYAQKCREKRLKIGDKSGVALAYVMEASSLEQLKEYDKAIETAKSAIKIQEEINDVYGLQFSYTIIANVSYDHFKQYDVSLEYYFKSRKIAEESQNVMALANIDYSIGSIFSSKGDYKKALEYHLNSLEISKKYGLKQEYKDGLLAISQTYSGMRQFEKAYNYQKQYSEMKDSMINESSSKQLNKLQTQYDTEKKQKEIELLTKDQEVKNERIARQNIITYTIVAGLVLVLVLAFISFKRYREKKKANIEITQQKEIIEIKNKEILDSIHYAKRIQRALLASDQLLNNNLPEHFVLYKPKDIVSGDFYWAQQTTNNNFLLATCDCTGHGVPGAFMSLLNISKLNETVIERKTTQPDLVFNHVREEIIKALNPDGTSTDAKDGMDAVLCLFDFNNMKMNVAAANNPVVIIRNNELIEIKPDKFPVGLHQGELKSFTLKSIDLQKGDVVYTFTDGFSDQFGGDNAKKLMSKNFKQILLKEHTNSMATQKENLNTIFENWRGQLEQLDDVLVIGVRV